MATVDDSITGVNYRSGEQLVRAVLSSEQHRILNKYKQIGKVKVGRHHGNMYKIFLSTRQNYNTDMKQEVTEWALEVDFAAMYHEILEYCKTNLNVHLYEEYEDYYKTKLPYALSYFDPQLHIDGLLEYGNNSGQWSDGDKAEFKKHYTDFFSMPNWNDDYASNKIPTDITSYNELLLKVPQFTMLNTKATSAWPDYRRQTPKWILENYGKVLNDKSNKKLPSTLYSRRHGASLKEGILVIKVREILGPGARMKFTGAGFGWSLKMRPLPIMPYFKPWDDVFSEMRDLYSQYSSKFWWTTDQSGFDKLTNEKPMYICRDVANEVLPPDLQNDFNTLFDNDIDKPRIVVNALEYIEPDKVISSSGDPLIPSIETGINYTLHEIYDPEPPYKNIQIDDMVRASDETLDLEMIQKDVRKRFGYVFNPSKTETNVNGYITFLQVHVGELIKGEDILYFGHIFRRLHRLKYKERMHEFANYEYDALTKEANPKVVDMPVAVSRMLGTICSLGDGTPYEITNIMFKHLSKSKTYQELLTYARDFDIVRKERFDYNFDPKWVLTRILEYSE